MSSTEIRRVTLGNGLGLEYAERGHGEPIVFLHGYTDSWRSFESVLDRLPAGFRGLALTLRGHGGSDRPASGYRIEDFAADTVAWFDALGLAEAALVGHSMGSLVALEIALGHPDRVSRLVLAGSSPRYESESVRELERAVSEMTDPVSREFAREFQAGTCHRPLAPERLERFVDETMKLPLHVWKGAIAGIVAYSAVERLPGLSTPTLVVAGGHDEIATAADRRLLGAIPGAKELSYEESGHAMHWEDPERFTDDVIAFLRESPRKAA